MTGSLVSTAVAAVGFALLHRLRIMSKFWASIIEILS